MKCADRELLKAHQRGEMSEAERAELEEHLQDCEVCRDAYARLESTQDDVANNSVGLFDPSQVPDLNAPGSGLAMEFGKALKAGCRPNIDEYLLKAPENGREKYLRELICEEYAHRWNQGELPTLAEYQARFPDDSDLVTRAIVTQPDRVRYPLLKVLGSGGMGTVFLADDAKMNRKVALKVIKPGHLTARALSRFQKELSIAKMELPGIVRVYDTGEFQNGQRYIVMQYIAGKTLREVRKDLPDPPDHDAILRATEIMTKIARAAHEAHRNGTKHHAVVHRDLKPENILIDENGIPHVADFGLAATVADLHEGTCGVGGTVDYMSPEQVRELQGRARGVDTRSDIWSLGAILFEMLTGTRPFMGDSKESITHAIEQDEVRAPKDLNKNIPLSLDEIIRRCLNKNKDERYQTAQELAEKLEDWKRSFDEIRGRDQYTREAWDLFSGAMQNFEPDYYFLLAAGRIAPAADLPRQNIGRLGWAWVADFDPDSETSGLLHACRPVIESHRTLHTVVRGNQFAPNIDRGTYWYFARGMTGRHTTLVAGTFVKWKQAYDHDLRQQLLALAKAGLQKPFVLLVVWQDDSLGPHLRTVIDATVSALGAAVQIVVACPQDGNEVRRLETEYGARVVILPVNHLFHGLATVSPLTDSVTGAPCQIPSNSGAPINIEGQDFHWLSEELEIVDLNADRTPSNSGELGRDFLRGHEISWKELGLQYDVERDLTGKVQQRIEDDLSKRRALRINLYHTPGGGGTTAARRLLWDLRRKFPCLLLRRTTPAETVDRIARVASLTALPILLTIDAGVVSDREADALYELLAARQLPVVLLQVLRRFSLPPSSSPRAFHLKAELSPKELERFVHFLAREAPARATELALAAKSTNKYEHTPFYLGLVAFGRDFVGLDRYIRGRLASASDVHARIVVYMSLAHYYGQRTVPAQAFADLLQLPPERSVDLARALPQEIRELLVEAERGRWRAAHALVAEECLAQLLGAGVKDREVWKERLSDWAKDFANFCHGSLPIPAETELDMAERVFVYRDNSQLLGTERAGSSQFSQLIEDVPSDNGRLEVLRHLTAVFPENAHFWAHLGRFYSMKMKEFPQALKAIDQALVLQPSDNTLHHMKGMAFRGEVYDLIGKNATVVEVVRKAEHASESFAEARRLSPEDEYGYISETQMIIRVLDHAGRFHDGNPMQAALDPGAPKWLRESVQVAEDLLEQVRRNRLGESSSEYEERCDAGVNNLYGDHDVALQQWGNVLSRSDVYKPPVRRQMVWTYLARRRRNWEQLTQKEVRRVVELLGQNMDQEPNDERNMRLWLKAIRQLQPPPTIESAIEKLAYWKTNSGALEPAYYLYVLYALKTIPTAGVAGSSLARDQALRAVEDCRGLARNRRNRTKSFEWLGPGEGLRRLVHQERLGEWDRNADFWIDSSPLERIGGVISRIRGGEAGEIEIEGGLTAFFVPGRSGHAKGRSENSPVTFFLGFSYEGLRAWDVQDRKNK